jgi:hypothetical protein
MIIKLARHVDASEVKRLGAMTIRNGPRVEAESYFVKWHAQS